ncbi:hypothetical protein EH153_07690 [Elizabethkingia anophelis]|uniref:hypothetical protein n=1 Tax=Elizabethkingia anophelis TaxID=1117645 RepID=UPI00136BEA76|nr:hypothetical protein [Elizabethkingia anophelis]MYY47863.1 hypothetical protein [Elizabethkingia anophelis]
MAVSNKNMSFRNERAKDLRLLSQLLSKVVGGDVTTYVLESVISQLQNKDFIPTLKNGSTDENIWGYDIEDFKMPLDTLSHVKPQDITKGEIILNMKLRAKIEHWNTYHDPFVELAYNVMIKGVGNRTYHFGFHIDKHIANAATKEPHPVYHLQYNFNPTKSSSPNLGDLFYIDTPRIMHKPIDFILGIGFLTSNFYPIAFESLKDEREFVKLQENYQNAIWKPYFHTIANKWKPFQETNIVWNPINDICPIFI